MAGAAAPFDLDVRGLVAAAEALADDLERLASADPRELLDRVGVTLESSSQKRFETKRDPDGDAWAPWQDDRYAARQSGGGGSLLSDEGRLRESITHQADGDRLAVGTPDVRAPTLFYGDSRLAWGSVPATWPGRQALGISDDDRADMAEDVASFVHRHGGGLIG